MSNLNIFHKTFVAVVTTILLIGVSLAGFFVQSLHVTHAATVTQDSVITCAGSLHNTDKAPCPSVKYQNVVVAVSSDSDRLSLGQNADNHILPESAQYDIPTGLLNGYTKSFLSRSFEKKNRWITQLPRAHLS